MALSHNTPGASVRAGDIELPLERVTVDGRVDGTGVVWTVVQDFVNTLDEATEAVYSFPLPAGGAVNKVTMRIGDRVVVADVKERGQAKVEYEEAVAKGHTAILMEQDAAEIFQTTVGNIHPGETVSVEIVVHDTVTRDGSEATVRFPTLIKPRFVPEGTPSSPAVNPPRHHGEVHVNSGVTVTFASPVEELVCDTVEHAELSPDSARIDDFSLDRDIVLRWEVAGETMDAKWTPDTDNPDMGTVEVVIRTNTRPTGMRKRRALSILLDRSGSMGDTDMQSGIRVAVDAIDAMDKDDLVHVLTFDSWIEAMDACAHGFVKASAANKSSLKRQLERVHSRGGTDLDGAITAGGAVLGLLDDDEDARDTERVVLLITDGAYGDEATAARQRDIELRGARVIVVGIGQDMNGYLEILAANGWFASVPSGHRTGEVSKQVCERINTPAHRNAVLEMDGLTEQAPHLAPDIYPGATVTLWGRAPRPSAGATVTVTTDSGPIASLRVRVSADSSATSRWAKARINAVDYDVMTGRVEESSGRAAIIELSVTHRVLSKYTAWVAVDTSRTTDSIVPVRIVQPSFMPDHMGAPLGLQAAFLHASALPARRLSMAMDSMIMDSMIDRFSVVVETPVMDADGLRLLVDELRRVLAGGKHHLDWQSILLVVEELHEWLLENDESVIGRRTHGKIARRLQKLSTDAVPTRAVQWKVLNELLQICEETVTRSPAPQGRLRSFFA